MKRMRSAPTDAEVAYGALHRDELELEIGSRVWFRLNGSGRWRLATVEFAGSDGVLLLSWKRVTSHRLKRSYYARARICLAPIMEPLWRRTR